MRYFIIAGEASGDIHGSQLIYALKRHDSEAQFSFFGGDMMATAACCPPIVHYRDMAYMGFIEVFKHLGHILGFLETARETIEEEKPDAVILIDYPSFNLKIAKFARSIGRQVFYFISPKVWAWKEFRVKAIKKYVTHMYSILPFETEFYRKHDYQVEYVGNPTVKEIAQASTDFRNIADFITDNDLVAGKPIIAIVPGSRIKEIRDNLPVMVKSAQRFTGFQTVIASAPSIDNSLYDEILNELGVKLPVIGGQTFELVHHSRAALVTSGTATLETAIIGTPQVVCYRMNGSKLIYDFYSHIIHGKYVSLPNLITDSAIIPELLLHFCSVENISKHLSVLLDDTPERQTMLEGYRLMAERLGKEDCTDNTAQNIISCLNA
jgi:lipid-A-disaccharide synthase